MQSLEDRLGYKFKDKGLLRNALIHRSFANESEISIETNERLEFLGDSVLAFLVAEKLFELYPDLSEGQLTRMRSDLVNGRFLANVARGLEFGSAVILGKGAKLSGGHRLDSVLADSFEAVVGAILLDGGLEECRSFVYRVFDLERDLDPDELGRKDFKTRLQERTQASLKSAPVYTTIDSASGDGGFQVRVLINGVTAGTGKGKSKAEAEQAAAQDALTRLSLES